MRGMTPGAAPLALCLLAAAGPAPASPAAAGGTRQDEIVMLGNHAGQQSVHTGSDGATHAEYSFNDRGRGDHITASWKLDAAGVLTEYQGSGNDYMKAPVTETFRLAGGKASWSNRSEHGSATVTGEAFYVPVNAPPELFGVLARALLKAPGHRLALLPAGEATLEKVELPAGDAAHATGPHGGLALYAISGLDFSPSPIWLESDGATAASVSDWFSVLPPAMHDQLPQLLAAQAHCNAVRSARLAGELTHVPAGEVVIRNARLFDPRDLSITAGTSVLVRGAHIVRVAADADVSADATAEVIDAHGR